jgi:hypothetical protein
MSYQVSYVTGEVNFEALPVAKITKYPLEKADYKPYAQCCICAGENGLSLRMWAFEVFASAESELRGVFYLFGDETTALYIRALAEDPVRVDAWVAHPGGEVPVNVTFSPHNGEDLQGVYWGAQIFVAYGEIERAAPMVPLKPGGTFRGNFYKLRTDKPHEHNGSFGPFDGMVEFEVVSW